MSNPNPSNTLKFLLFILFLVVCVLLGRRFAFNLEDFRAFMGHFPLIVSGAIFVVLYAGLTTLVWVGPKDILRVAAAFVFGAWASTLFVWVGEMCNLVIMFHLSRKLGRGFIEEKFKIKQESVERARHRTNILGIAALRVNPLFPFRLMDLSYGLSAVPFKKYFLVSLIVSPVRIFWLQAILAGVGTAFLKSPGALIQYLLENKSMLYGSFAYFALIAVISLVAVGGKWRTRHMTHDT